MDTRYFGLSDSTMCFFSEIARDFESGMLSEIPLVVKAAFVDDWNSSGIGFQIRGLTHDDFNSLEPGELDDKIVTNLLVRYNGKPYAVGVEKKDSEVQPLISVWNLEEFQYVNEIQIPWNNILLSYMKKFWNKTRASMTLDSDIETYNYIDSLSSQIDWNNFPEVVQLN